jgi:hypothetical protein
MTFSASHFPRTDDPGSIFPDVRMSDEECSAPLRLPERDEPALIDGVVGIVEGESERVEGSTASGGG